MGLKFEPHEVKKKKQALQKHLIDNYDTQLFF